METRTGANGADHPAPASSEVLIELTRVSKEYRSEAGLVRALRDVSVSIARGEFVAIVGTSGSGKSTMMNILGCLDRPTRGTYSLGGLDVGGRTNDGRAIVRNRLIGFIFQGFNLLSRTTALENVELPLQYRGVPAGERRVRATRALEAVNLAERMYHTPNQLSGGQQQRVAIARALVTDPPLLLADEPTGNLDTRTSYEVLALLQRLNRERGITICLVTHEHDIAACASRVIVVRDGRIESDTRQDEPIDAAAALAQLPPPQEASAGGDRAADSDAAHGHVLRGGPVPRSAGFAMAGGLALGALVGLLYDAVVLGAVGATIPVLLGFVGEAWWGARRGAKVLGHPLAADQRARLALVYTLITTAVIAFLAGWLVFPTLPASSFDAWVAPGRLPWGIALALLLFVLALALLRYLLLTFFGSGFFQRYVAGRPRRASAP
ncbi:ABC transporter ATP-binding protein [Pendulispora albinea]|uniref:ABC transporter ATP-binding protein n=1 Tax=Pendulispora albinea TaxID=2741071 RepID=UPI00374E1353